MRWRVRTPAGGYDRIVGALANLGRNVSDQTVGNVLCGPWDRAGSEAESDYGMEGFHRGAHGGSGVHGGPATYYVLFVVQLERDA